MAALSCEKVENERAKLEETLRNLNSQLKEQKKAILIEKNEFQKQQASFGKKV